MNAIAYLYTCAECGHQLKAPETGEFSYGMFVMRAEKSDYAVFLNALEDSAFLESSQMVKEYPQIAKLPDRERAAIQQRVYGMICDRTPTGEMLIIGLPPKCPSCGSRKMKSWKQIQPSETWPLPVVEHKSWDNKSANERLETVDRSIQEVLKKR
jgi:DNA-directed RNA polymerase subunit RPC12/RpoP